MSDRASKLQLTNTDDLPVNPATEDKQDDIIAKFDWTNDIWNVWLLDWDDIRVTVQNPLPVDWDSVYTKDLNTAAGTTIWTFSWDIWSLFNDYWEEITDTSATNPKTFTLRLLRPVTTSQIWIWSNTSNFSNVKIMLKDLAWNIRRTVDDSTNNTKFTSFVYGFQPITFIEAVVEFHTADTVKISWMFIPKDISTVSRIQALKPDWIVTNIGASVDSNLHIANKEDWFSIAQWIVTWKIARHKFWRNPDIGTWWFEAIWNWGWDYTWFNATAEQTIAVVSSSDWDEDTWTLLSSWTATWGSTTTLIDTWATFVTDTVAVWDVLINDTQTTHWIVTAVTETTITVDRMDKDETNASWDIYRVATSASTWACVVRLDFCMWLDYVEVAEYVILNWNTIVNTIWTFIRNSRIEVVCAGSWGSNVWTITANQSTTTANIFAVMPIWYNQTMIAAMTIPAWKTWYMSSWFASLARKKDWFSNVRFMSRHKWEVFQVKEEFTISASWSSYVQRIFDISKDDMPQKSDIKIMSDASASDMWVAAWFDLIIIDN